MSMWNYLPGCKPKPKPKPPEPVTKEDLAEMEARLTKIILAPENEKDALRKMIEQLHQSEVALGNSVRQNQP